jgi:hypothetical protein
MQNLENCLGNRTAWFLGDTPNFRVYSPLDWLTPSSSTANATEMLHGMGPKAACPRLLIFSKGGDISFKMEWERYAWESNASSLSCLVFSVRARVAFRELMTAADIHQNCGAG